MERFLEKTDRNHSKSYSTPGDSVEGVGLEEYCVLRAPFRKWIVEFSLFKGKHRWNIQRFEQSGFVFNQDSAKLHVLRPSRIWCGLAGMPYYNYRDYMRLYYLPCTRRFCPPDKRIMAVNILKTRSCSSASLLKTKIVKLKSETNTNSQGRWNMTNKTKTKNNWNRGSYEKWSK